MTDQTGVPVWYELIAEDAAAAQAFYTHVVGWRVADSGMPGIDYRLFTAPDDQQVAGLMQRPPEMGGGALWLTYFGVDDVDAAANAIAQHGGAVHLPPTSMVGVGRMAMAADPQGAMFYVMKGEGEGPSTAFRQGPDATPGHAVWNELTAPDQDAAMAFYGVILGLRHEGAMPMGLLGDYKFVHAGSVNIGASMNTPPDGRLGWMPNFLVPDIDEAVTRVNAGGGRVVQDPIEIPGGGYSIVAEDPEGVRFGLVGERSN